MRVPRFLCFAHNYKLIGSIKNALLSKLKLSCNKKLSFFYFYQVIMKSKLLLLGLLGAMAATAFAEEPQPVTGWLFPRGTVDSWTAKYFYATGTNFSSDGPAADWFQPDFNDSAWDVITGPVGNKNWCNTTWNTGNSSYWLRCEFDMEDINFDEDVKHLFKTVHNDGAVAYLNGHQFFSHNGVCGNEHVQEIPSQYLLKGRNVLAVMVNNGGGDAYIDFGITSSDVNFESSAKTITYNGMEFRTNGDEARLFSIGNESTIDVPETITYNNKDYTVTSMATSVFVGKNNIVRLTLPSTLTSIENIPFTDCPDIVRLSINTPTPPALSKDMYTDFTDRYLFVPDEAVEAYKAAEHWNKFEVLPVSIYDDIVLKGDIFFIDGVRYIVTSQDDKTVAVSNKGNDESLNKTGDVVIADEITLASEAYTVTEVQDKAFQGWEITSINFGNNVRKLGTYAFFRCHSLQSVIFPAQMTNWGSGVFAECNSLNSITVPEGVTRLEGEVFEGCPKLEQIIFPTTLKTIGFNTFMNCTSLNNLVFPDGFISIDDDSWVQGAFINCSSLTNIDWGKGIQKIGVRAFANTGIKTLDNLPLSLTKINDSAFDGCKSLTKVVIPNGITDLAGVFCGCTNLTDVTLPSSLETLDCTFNGCKSLKHIDLKNIKKLYGWAFQDCTSLESIEFPATLEEIGNNYRSGVFIGCTSLTEVYIPETVQSVYMNALFKNCINLKKVTIKSKTLCRTRDTFRDCTKLESVVFEKEITIPGGKQAAAYEGEYHHMFDGCTTIEEIVLPEGFYHIPRATFARCSNLKRVVLPTTTISIGTNCFEGCFALETIDIPESVKTIGEYCFLGDEKLKYVNFGNNQLIDLLPNYCFQGCTELANFDVPKNVIRLGKGCFTECESLKTISLPATVTSLGDGCFENCSQFVSMICYAPVPPLCGTDVFSGTLYQDSEAKLYVPGESATDYLSSEQWCDWSNILSVDDAPINIEIALDDSAPFEGYKDVQANLFSYSRIFKNTNWQSIILPVSLDYEDFCNDFEIAKIYNIIVTQSVEGGDLGDASIQIVKLKEGDYTVPNVPYMIKAKVADSENAQALSKENCVVYRANPQSLECSNTETAFTFTGTYSAISAADLAGYYAMSGGSWYHQTGTAGLKPMRAYMSITSKTGGYNSTVANHAPIRVSVVGEEEAGEVSAIITLTADTDADEGIIIDRQLIGLPVGSYNLRGKKVIVK